MIEVQNKTKKKAPKFNWLGAKDLVLGKKYELSLVFCGNTTSRRLNKIYRNKDKATNVLSFPISKQNGELFLDLDTANKEAKELKKPVNKWVPYLYIHGLYHLSGLGHGKKMDALESKLIKKYSL